MNREQRKKAYPRDKVAVEAHLDQLVEMVRKMSSTGAHESDQLAAFTAIVIAKNGSRATAAAISALWAALLRLSKLETVVPYNDEEINKGQHMPGVEGNTADVSTLYEELHHIRQFWADTNDSLKALTEIMNQRGDLIAAAAGQALARLHDLAMRGDVLMRKYEQVIDERLGSGDEQPTS